MSDDGAHTFDGMPTRLWSCTPTKLDTWLSCPRRFRFTYLDRRQKGLPWAHNSVGSSVHNALRDWWLLPRRPAYDGRGRRAREARLAHRRLPRRRADPRVARAAPPTMTAAYVADLDPAGRARRRRAHGVDDHARHGAVRPRRPHRPPRERRRRRGARDRRLQDRTPPPHRRRRALLARPGGVRRRCRAHAAPPVAPRRAAPPALGNRCGARPHAGVARAPPDAAPSEIAVEASAAEAVWKDRLAARAEDAAAGDADAVEAIDAHFPPSPGPSCSWCDYRRWCPSGRDASHEISPWSGLADAD